MGRFDDPLPEMLIKKDTKIMLMLAPAFAQNVQ